MKCFHSTLKWALEKYPAFFLNAFRKILFLSKLFSFKAYFFHMLLSLKDSASFWRYFDILFFLNLWFGTSGSSQDRYIDLKAHFLETRIFLCWHVTERYLSIFKNIVKKTLLYHKNTSRGAFYNYVSRENCHY